MALKKVHERKIMLKGKSNYFVFVSLKLRLCATGCELCVCKHRHCRHMFNIMSERLRRALFNVVFDQLKGATSDRQTGTPEGRQKCSE